MVQKQLWQLSYSSVSNILAEYNEQPRSWKRKNLQDFIELLITNLLGILVFYDVKTCRLHLLGILVFYDVKTCRLQAITNISKDRSAFICRLKKLKKHNVT